MADITSILSASYKSTGLSIPSKTAYVAVDPKTYQGTWTGNYADNKTFKITVSDVTGFRAKVKYQSSTTVKYGDVLIKDKSFRIGDTKFTLAKAGRRPRLERRGSKTSSPIPRPAQPISIPPPQHRVSFRPCGRWREAAAALPLPDRACGNRRGGARRLHPEIAGPPNWSGYRRPDRRSRPRPDR
jgi:hypothetical protein